MKCIFLRIFLFSLFVFLTAEGTAVPGIDTGTPPLLWQEKQDSLSASLSRLIQKSGLKEEHLGISIYSTKSRAILFHLNEEKPAILASNTKLFTSTAALARLGAHFQFNTLVTVRGPLNPDGTLNGDVVVIGDGDPTISGRFTNDNPLAIFTQWAQKLKEAGIKTVTGDLLLDDHVFDTQWIHPAWEKDDLGQWYAAPPGALSLNDNCLDIHIRGARKAGDPASITLSPDTRYVTVVNRTSTVKGASKKGMAFSWENGRQLVVKGDIKTNATMTLNAAVDHPTLFFGTVLKETLERNGISFQGTMNMTPPIDAAGLTVIVRHESDLLRALMIANRNSQNFYAECLLKRLGYHIKHEGSTAAGVQAVQDWLKESGMAPIEMIDGCGLAKGNRASPAQVVALLKWILDQPFAETFVQTLAVSGASEGTLRKRFKDPDLAGRIHAKTGYLNGVKAISGYVDTRQKDRIVFSMLVNDITGNGSQKVNELQEDILRLLVQQ